MAPGLSAISVLMSSELRNFEFVSENLLIYVYYLAI